MSSNIQEQSAQNQLILIENNIKTGKYFYAGQLLDKLVAKLTDSGSSRNDQEKQQLLEQQYKIMASLGKCELSCRAIFANALIHMKTKDFQKAQLYMQLLIESNDHTRTDCPYLIESLQRLALMYAKTIKLFPKARQLLDRCKDLLLNKADSDDPRLLQIELSRARLETESGDWQLAQSIFDSCQEQLTNQNSRESSKGKTLQKRLYKGQAKLSSDQMCQNSVSSYINKLKILCQQFSQESPELQKIKMLEVRLMLKFCPMSQSLAEKLIEDLSQSKRELLQQISQEQDGQDPGAYEQCSSVLPLKCDLILAKLHSFKKQSIQTAQSYLNDVRSQLSKVCKQESHPIYIDLIKAECEIVDQASIGISNPDQIFYKMCKQMIETTESEFSIENVAYYFNYCLKSCQNSKILKAIELMDIIKSQCNENSIGQSMTYLAYSVSKAAFQIQLQTKDGDSEDQRFAKALTTIQKLFQQALLLLNKNTENVHLENFYYQMSLCQAILGRYAEAQQTLIGLIQIRKKIYTIKGCCSVDPLKLLLDPYSKLCFIYEELGQEQDSLRLAEKAIYLFTDIQMIHVEGTLYLELQKSQRSQYCNQLLVMFKKFLVKAKIIAIKCGDEDQKKQQTVETSLSGRNLTAQSIQSEQAQSFYEKALKMDEHLVRITKAEFGIDHSNYAMALLDKAKTLVAASAREPVTILDELAEAQEAECRALMQTGKSLSVLLLRIQILKGTVLQKLMGNHRHALTIFTKASEVLQEPENLEKLLKYEMTEAVYNNLSEQLRNSIIECQNTLKGVNLNINQSKSNGGKYSRRSSEIKNVGESQYGEEDDESDESEHQESDQDDDESVYIVGLGLIFVVASAGFFYSYLSSKTQQNQFPRY